MKISLDNFIIECDKELDYINEVVSTLENKTSDILDFFELKGLKVKKRVIIFTSRDKYKKHLLNYVKEFKEWMCGDTFDGNINLLDINEARKSVSHQDMSLNEFIEDIKHEFVHSCQQEINPDAKDEVVWFWEALATNLSGQSFDDVDLSKCDFKLLKEDFANISYGYPIAYKLGKYMLENYPHGKILDYIKNPNLLVAECDEIFLTAVKNHNSKVRY